MSSVECRTSSVWIALLFLGCGPLVEFVPINTPPRALMRRPATSVELFTTKPPERSFIEVGLITARESFGDKNELMDSIKTEAADVGCDAIVLNGDLAGGRYIAPGYRATCIVYK